MKKSFQLPGGSYQSFDVINAPCREIFRIELVSTCKKCGNKTTLTRKSTNYSLLFHEITDEIYCERCGKRTPHENVILKFEQF